MPITVKDLLTAARAAVPMISPQDAAELIAGGKALAVDVRDGTEVAASGKVKGALHVSRGLLEFKADRESPAYDPALGRAPTIIVYCASGGRSALSGKVLQEMGYTKVHNLGGFKDWVEGGGEVEK